MNHVFNIQPVFSLFHKSFYNFFHVTYKHLCLKMSLPHRECCHILRKSCSKEETFSNDNSVHIVRKSPYHTHYRCNFLFLNECVEGVDLDVVSPKILNYTVYSNVFVLSNGKANDFSIPMLSWSTYCNIHNSSCW